MKELDKYKKAMESLPKEIREAEAELEKQSTVFIRRKDGKDAGGGYSDTGELFVRASGDKTGRAYTQNLERDPLEMIREAYENSLYSAETAAEPLNDGRKAQGSGTYPKEEYRGTEELRSYAAVLERALSGSRYCCQSAEITVSRTVKSLGVVNTKGLQTERESLRYTVSVRADFAYNGTAQANFDLSSQCLVEITPEKVRETAESIVCWHLPLTSGKAGPMPCVLAGSAVSNIFFTAWKMFSGQNYADRKSRLCGYLDQQISCSALQITDYVRSRYSGYTFDIDCEGTNGTDTVLVKDGVLCGLLHNLKSADACQGQPTGNAGRRETLSGTVQMDTLITPKNLVIAPGEKTTETLIKEMGTGIYINQSFDEFHSFNFTSGDFSIPCEGILIENGLPQGRVVNMTINGNILELLADIKEIGREMYSFPVSTMDSYTVHAPAVRLDKVVVSV